MARRVQRTGGRVSVFYASQGPLRSAVLRYCDGDRERAEQIRGEFRAWKAQHGEAWLAGVHGTPAPSYADVLDHFAKATR